MQKNQTTAEYSFTVNMLKDNPKKVLGGILIIVAAYFFFSFFFDAYFGVLALILLVLSLPELFFPFKYKLFTDRIIVDRFFYKVSHEYSYYKKVIDDKHGIFLSPYRIKTRMENFRGILIRVPADKKDEVLEFLKTKIVATEERVQIR